MPPGYSISWSGQFEYLERATHPPEDRVPAVLAICSCWLVSCSAERAIP